MSASLIVFGYLTIGAVWTLLVVVARIATMREHARPPAVWLWIVASIVLWPLAITWAGVELFRGLGEGD